MTEGRPLRADAVRNRELVLAAAAELFAERGLEVSLDEIAHRAGLGVGTVYRRFPNRGAIVEALFEERIANAIALAHECAADEDPRRGLLRLLRNVCEDMATDRGMRQFMLGAAYADTHLAAGRAALEPIARQLVARCHEAGVIRPGFAASDIPALFVMLGAIGDAASHAEPQLWERYFELMVTGILAAEQPALSVPALPDDDMHGVLDRWRRTKGD